MSWDSERSLSGKRPWQWIEIEVDRCTLTYGNAPCTAALGVTGEDKCYNSWETCQDQPNFDKAAFFIRFCEPAADLPRAFTFADAGLPVFLPFLRSVTHSPSLPDPGESLGLRAQLDVQLLDAPHHDIGLDKYVTERAFDPQAAGLMLRKLRVRFPHYLGRRLRWYQGYLTDSPAPADFRVREYIIERFEGPDTRGRVRIVAKDLLKLLDDERAQAPMKSRGELATAFAEAAAITTIDVDTSDTAEYDLKAGETEDYVRIGNEVFTYTGVTVVDADSVQLTGVTRAAPSPYVTEADDHELGDAVQRCRYFSGTVPEVVEELLVDYAGIDASFLPTTDWDTEWTTWLAGNDIARLVTEPEGVRTLVNEIIGSTLTWAFWFDEIEQEIKYRAIRPADIDDVVVDLNDDQHLVADSIQIVDQPDYIRNEVQVLYGQIDPTARRDEVENYRRGLVVIDADSQSENELGQRRIKRVFARWHPSSNDAVVRQFADRTLSARTKNLMTVEFKLDRKDENIQTAQFADLTTIYLLNALGVPNTTRVQVLRVAAHGEAVTYRAREDFFKPSAFGRLAPVALDGLLWTAATDDQKARYMFLADATGEFSNGDAGKTLA